jgi:hypothetical protein
MRKSVALILIAACVIFASAHASAQGNVNSPNVAQVVAWTNAIPPRLTLTHRTGQDLIFAKTSRCMSSAIRRSSAIF